MIYITARCTGLAKIARLSEVEAEQPCDKRFELERVRARPIFATLWQISSIHSTISRERPNNGTV